MSKARERSINLSDWEARAMRALPAGGTMLLSRPITPQPNTIGARIDKFLRYVAPPWQVGDVLLCREAWVPARYGSWVKSTCPTKKGPWRSAATMPRWAVRLKPTVIGVRAEKICNVSGLDPVKWNERWGTRYPWASNPLAWTLEVKR